MNDGFKPGERRLVVKNHRAQRLAINLAVKRGSRERALNKRHRFAFIERVHDGIRIVDRHPAFGEEFRRGRFSHAERTGEAEHEWSFGGH